MKMYLASAVIVCLLFFSFTSCHAKHEAGTQTSKTSTAQSSVTKVKDDQFIGKIETDAYVMKLHRVIEYAPKSREDIMPGIQPREGYRFIYLDVSLSNKIAEPLDAGPLFIALKVSDEKGMEYKKPAIALAAWCTQHPGVQDHDEYRALWKNFKPGESHRALIYAVEVPVNTDNFIITLPTDRKIKEWRSLQFTV